MLHKIPSKNKVLHSIIVILFIAAFFPATQPIDNTMSVVSSFMVILFAVPSYVVIAKILGKKFGLLLIVLLGIYALLVESTALATGFPYGNFIYNDLLGNKVFGLTPWTVAFAYPPIILMTYWFARNRHKSHIKVLLASALLAMCVDLVLDPAAVTLGFWEWVVPGVYYGVPVVNFLGWILTSFIGAGIIHLFMSKKHVPIGFVYSGLAILWFWTAVNIWLVQLFPSVIGVMLCVLFTYQISRKKVHY
jgi:bisanhydrobacterioruberin hydratase